MRRVPCGSPAHCYRVRVRFYLVCSVLVAACGGEIATVDGPPRVDAALTAAFDAAGDERPTAPVDASAASDVVTEQVPDASVDVAPAPACPAEMQQTYGCGTGRYFMQCASSDCLSDDWNSICSPQNPACTSECDSDEYGVWCGLGTDPLPDASCRSVDAFSGTLTYCCSCD
jgi:hypothetical protein